MEPPAHQPPAPLPLSPRTTTRDSRLLLIIGGVVVVLLLVGYVLYRFWGVPGADLFPRNADVVLSSKAMPVAAAQRFDTKSGTLEPLRVEGQGTAAVVAAARAEDHSLYLISDPTFTRANLYRKDAADGANLAQLTFSDGIKYDLSYDAQSGTAAYVSQTGATSRIVAWSASSNEEKDLGEGSQPTVLPGGFFVVALQNGKLVAIRVDTGKTHTLLEVGTNPFAVNAQKVTAAVYEPGTRSVHTFSLAGMTGASFAEGTPLEREPAALGYSGESVFAVYKEENGAAFGIGTRAEALPPAVAEALLDSQEITIYDIR